MNLRKLLCGLLALCLLLTMAPAALMEEAPVEEVVVELGGEEVAAVEEAPEEIAGEALEADDFYSDSFKAAKERDGELELPTNKDELGGTTWLAIDEYMTIGIKDGYELISASSKNARVADIYDGEEEAAGDAEDEDEAAATSVTIEGKRVGTAVINIKLGAVGSTRTTTFNVNIKVYDPKKPAAIDLYAKTLKGYELTSKTTVEIDMCEVEFDVVAAVLPVGGEVYWSTSNAKVAKPVKSVTWTTIEEEEEEEEEEEIDEAASELVEYVKGNIEDVDADGYRNTIKAVGKGTATITAKCGSVSASFKVKVTDKYAPKSISLKADKTTMDLGEMIGLWTVVSPRPYWDSPVNFTLDSTKYVKFVVTNADKDEYVLSDAKSIDFAEGKCYIVGVGEGTAKITAKTYNGKKSSIKIKVVNPYKPASIAIKGFYKGEKATTELYNEDWTLEYSDPTDPVLNAFVLVPELKDGKKNVIDPDYTAAYEYANIKWTSSNKKVAKVSVYKDWDGYFNDQAPEVLDFWGNSFFEDEDTAEDVENYAALVEIVGTGSTKITAKTRDGKYSFSITLKVVNSHKSTGIYVSSIGTIPVGESVDLNEFVRVDPADFYGTYTIKPSHSTSKVSSIGDTEYIGNKAATVTFKVKTSDGRSKSFKVKFA